MSGRRLDLVSPPLSTASLENVAMNGPTSKLQHPPKPMSGPSPQASPVMPGFGPGPGPGTPGTPGGMHTGMPPPRAIPPSSRQSAASTTSSSYPVRLSSTSTSFGPPRAPSLAGSVDGRQVLLHMDTFRRHHSALKTFLNMSSPGLGHTDTRPNRARDKLRRLQPIPFQELSTDVYDELLRRQDAMAHPSTTAPALLPQTNFHVKRNQARQKLSTLPVDRFNQLATDVFYELEQRHPGFVDGGSERSASPAASVGSHRNMAMNHMHSHPPNRGPSGSYGPHGPGPYGPPGYAKGPMPPPNGPRPGYNRDMPPSGMPMSGYPGGPGGSNAQSPSSAYPHASPNGMHGSTPTLPVFHNDSIIPVMTTVVVDDDDADSSATGSVAGSSSKRNSRANGYASNPRGPGMSSDQREALVREHATKLSTIEAEHAKVVSDINSELSALREQTASLQSQLEQRDSRIAELQQFLKDQQKEHDQQFDRHTEEVASLKQDRDDSSQRVELLEVEVTQLKSANEELSRSKSEAMENQSSEIEAELISRYEALQEQYSQQKRMTDEVRQEASRILADLNSLSLRQANDLEREEQLVQRNMDLEREIDEWKSRYAKTRTLNGGLRLSVVASTVSVPNTLTHLRDSTFLRPDGLVRDLHMTKFQFSIDELLKSVRQDEAPSILDCAKQVAFIVTCIHDDVDSVSRRSSVNSADNAATETPSPGVRQRLTDRVTATANNLITATKNHISSAGMSPISLIDAAASHLTTAIIDLVRHVKIRPSNSLDFAENEVYGVSSVPSLISGTASTAASATSVITPTSKDRYEAEKSIPNGLNRASVASSGYSISSVLDEPRSDAGDYRWNDPTRSHKGLDIPGSRSKENSMIS